MTTKINRLSSVHTLLGLRAHQYLKRLLRPVEYALTADTSDEHAQNVGFAVQLQTEINEHCDSLAHIAAACQHGLTGTSPEGYEEDGYEFTEEPHTPELPYDPYTDILGYLHGGGNISCLTLSPLLLRFISVLPEAAALRAEHDVAQRTLLQVNEDGSTRPMTRRELRQRGNRDVVEAVEDSLFAETYAADLQQITTLAEQRGDLQQILDLL